MKTSLTFPNRPYTKCNDPIEKELGEHNKETLTNLFESWKPIFSNLKV